MKQELAQWKHLFKLDPDRVISDAALERICLSGTDAVMVGGSSGVTFDNTVDLLYRVRQFEVPVVLEVSEQDAIVPGFDLYLVPLVLNTEQGKWIVGEQHRAIKQFGQMIPWSVIVPEGYVILNKQSKVAERTGANVDLDADDLAAYAEMADHLLSLPVLYLEYSGRFGDMALVKRTRETLEHARLFYGGGIDNVDKARQALTAADTIIVGNAIYDDLEQALQTVAAANEI